MLRFFKKNNMEESNNATDCLANDNHNELNPPIFTNRPIKSKKEDIIGFSTQINAICEAMDSGSTMIGIIADYGTGKSSLTELLSTTITQKPCKYPIPIIINMWDCLGGVDNNCSEQVDTKAQADSGAEDEISVLTKSFLYQLAGEKKHFRNYINKRLSRNYGNVSFAASSRKFWVFFVSAVICYTIYTVFSNGNAFFGSVIRNQKLLSIVRILCAFNPAFLCLAGVLLIIGLINTCITFSHWKMQSSREAEINDVFDAYTEIIARIKPKKKNRKQIIIIEDLDRIVDKATIIGFLREIYRFQNSMGYNSDKFVFIVSIKPEAILENDKRQIDDKNVYSKLFDIIIPLKPIHYDDYDTTLLSLINSDADKKKRLEKLIEEDISEDTLPEDFHWIKKGQNLSLRDLKNRLNSAILIMNSRKSYKVRTAVTFEACAAVVYLESAYPEDYYALIQNESAFAKLMSNSVGILDATEGDEAVETLVEEFNKQFSASSFNADFISDICQLISDGVFNYDFRMYFYTYPSGSHIKTTEERELCDMLLMPSRYNDYRNIGNAVAAVYANGDDNIVTQTLAGLSKYPEAVLMDAKFLEVACNCNLKKAAHAIDSFVITPMRSDESTIAFWNRVHNISVPNKSGLIHLINEYFIARFSNPEEFASARTSLVAAFGKDITEFRKLFFTKNQPDIPLITEQEIALIDDIAVSLDLIDTDNLSEDDFIYITDFLCQGPLSEPQFDKAMAIIKKYSLFDIDESSTRILNFMDINHCVNNDLFQEISKHCNKSRIANYLNNLELNDISDEYIQEIENLGFETGLSAEILKMLAEKNRYVSVLLTASQSSDFTLIDTQLGNEQELLSALKWIQENYPAYIPNLRNHLCCEKGCCYALFESPFPLITSEEYVALHNTSDAIQCIDVERVDEENYGSVIGFITQRQYSSEELILLFQRLFDNDHSSSSIIETDDLFSGFVDGLDYPALRFNHLPPAQRDEIYSMLSCPCRLPRVSRSVDTSR